jgi:pilus assembly protein CpaE
MDSMRRDKNNELSALLIAPDQNLAREFTASLADSNCFLVLAELKTYPTTGTLDIRLRQLNPHVVLIDAASDLDAACELIRHLASNRPGTQVVALHRQKESPVVVRVLRCGASEFLHSPFDRTEQREAAARLRRLIQPEEASVPDQGRVIVCTSTKPGAGASTVAAYSAHALRKASGGRVLLIDLDLEGGTLAFLLKLQPKYSVVDALQQGDRLDAGVWSVVVSQAAGLDILPAPDQPYSEALSIEQVRTLVEQARLLYDWIILDAGAVFQRFSLMLLSEADQNCLVTAGDLGSLHMARKAVSMLTGFGIGSDRYQIVVNRFARNGGIGGADIKKILGSPVMATLPNDYHALHRVIALGQPLGEEGELGRAFAALARQLMEDATAERKGKTEETAETAAAR